MTRVHQAGPAGWKEVYVRGHPRTQPLLSIETPSDGNSYRFVPSGKADSYILEPVAWAETPFLWSDYNRWPLATDATRWRFGALLLDLAVLLTIPLVFATATEWWVRRRGGTLRFRLVDLALLVVLCSAALAWRQSHVVLRGVEDRFEKQASPFFFFTSSMREAWEGRQEGREPTNAYQRRYCGPDWARRLLGNQEFLRSTKHLAQVQLVPDESWHAKIELLPRLTYLESASFPSGVTTQAIERLEEVPHLRKIQLSVVSRTPQVSLEDEASGVDDHWVRAQDLAALRSLLIEELGLMGDNILVEDIEAIATMPRLKRIELVEPAITLSQLEKLRREHPHLEITAVWGRQFWTTSYPGNHYRFDDKPTRDIESWINTIKQRRTGS